MIAFLGPEPEDDGPVLPPEPEEGVEDLDGGDADNVDIP